MVKFRRKAGRLGRAANKVRGSKQREEVVERRQQVQQRQRRLRRHRQQ
jgi:hypothetical protein